MDRIRWIRFFLIALALLIIPLSLWWSSPFFMEDPEEETQPSPTEEGDTEEFEPQVSQAAMDEILAEDLSLTTSLFINQLSEQLKRWAENDFSDQEWQSTFSRELSEHPQFESFALLEEDQIRFQEGDFPQDQFLQLVQDDSKQVEDLIYSDPYEREERDLLLIAYQTKHGETEQWVGGEVDISFVQSYVGDVADVADANGHFFVHQGDPQVRWKDKKDRKDVSEKVIPELEWSIVVESEGSFDTQELTHYSDGEVMVKFKDESSAENWVDRHREYHTRKHFGRYYILEHEQMSTSDMIRSLQAEPEVLLVEPNYIFEKQQNGENDPQQISPNDEFFEPYQWNLELIQAEEGWEITEGDEDIVIAILDTGIDGAHQDLEEKLTDGFNAFDDSPDFSDTHGHGTHVAGIAAAVTNNVTGIAGVSWDNQIMPIKVLDEQGEGSLYEITKGIIWATDQGADVINLSLGDHEHADMLYEAIQYASEQDVILIAASGNENVETPMYPAAYDEVLAVSAIDQQQQKAVFSNYGDYIDVTAPGEHIPSTFMGDQYVFMSGTSMAAPHVSGLAGLIRSLNPDLSSEEVLSLIRETADDLGEAGHDLYYGYGQLNVSRALQTLADDHPIQPQNREEPLKTNGKNEETEEQNPNETGETAETDQDPQRHIFREDGRSPLEQLFDYLWKQFSA